MVADGEGDEVPDESHETKTERYVRSLEDRVEYLRQELDQEREAKRETNLIIAALKERITQLEASQTATVEPERREPHLPTVGTDDPTEADEHPLVHKVSDNMKNAVLKNDAVLVQFAITAGASIVAVAVLVISVSNGQVVLAGLAGTIALLSIAGFLSHLWLFFPSAKDRIQEKPSDPGSAD